MNNSFASIFKLHCPVVNVFLPNLKGKENRSVARLVENNLSFYCCEVFDDPKQLGTNNSFVSKKQNKQFSQETVTQLQTGHIKTHKRKYFDDSLSLQVKVKFIFIVLLTIRMF